MGAPRTWHDCFLTAFVRYCAYKGVSKDETSVLVERLYGEVLDKGTLGVQYPKGCRGEKIPTLSPHAVAEFEAARVSNGESIPALTTTSSVGS